MVPQFKTSRPASILDLAIRLSSLGYWPIAIPRGRKGPLTAGWEKWRITAENATEYFTSPGMVVGALHTNLACFDIDVYDADLAAEIIAEGFRRFPGALERIGQPPKSAIVLRLDDPSIDIRNTEKHSLVNGQGEVVDAQMEVRTGTGQMVVYGIHPSTNRPYEWPRGELWDTPRDDLPALTAADAQSFRDWVNKRIRQWAGKDDTAPAQTAMIIDIGTHHSFSGAFADERPSEKAFLIALRYVPASLGYNDGWCETLMAIHEYYGGSTRGLEIAKDWSSADARYHPREIESKWGSFKAGGGTTYKTVMHHAKAYGCDMATLRAVDYPPRIVPPETRTSTPHVAIKSNDSPLKDWVFLSAENDFYNIVTADRMTVSAFNLAMEATTPSVEFTKPDGEVVMKKFTAAKTLLVHLNGKAVASTMYRPDQGERFFWVDGIEYVNSYLPQTVPTAATDWAGRAEWQICKEHIENILNDSAPTIIQWMAHNVQFPGAKILWAPIIVGVQGDGKTTLSKIMQAAMGRANVSPVSPEAMFSDFTGWAEGSCVKVLEEIRVHGNSRHNAMDKLKPLITNDNVEIVRKGKDGKQIANVTNYMALTNHMDALALDKGDRRWGVFKTRFETRQEMLAELKDAYWDRLHRAINATPGVIRGWLLAVDLSGFNRVVGPDTGVHKCMMIEAARSPAESDMAEAVAIGGFGVGPDVLATDCMNNVIHGFGGKQLNTNTIFAFLSTSGWVKHDLTVKWRGKNRRIYYRKIAEFEGIDGTSLSRLVRMRLDETDEDFRVET